MSTIQRMFRSHPKPVATSGDVAAKAVEACFECVQSCTVCADACLYERDTRELVQCIRLNEDCADLCGVTGRVLCRPGHTDAPMLRAQLEACIRACRACADECERHARHMEHCRICADACKRCAEACERMLMSVVA
jgi:hypothetical protein